jgi:hypothetical protein
MRMLSFALLAFIATPALIAIPALAADDASYPVMPETPSGQEGDPNAMVCRAPQPLAGSGAMGPKICMHNSVWARLTMTGQDLAADGKSVFVRPAVADPTGAGNPDAVTCRRPAEFTASRVRRGPEVCLTNRRWKDLAKNQQRVNSAGQIVSTRMTGPAALGEIPVTAIESSPPL